jgi:hypothetical protein
MTKTLHSCSPEDSMDSALELMNRIKARSTYHYDRTHYGSSSHELLPLTAPHCRLNKPLTAASPPPHCPLGARHAGRQ